jgi:hypothetical protein
MEKNKVVLVVLLVLTAAVVQGCVVAAVGAGAGTVAYLRGDLEVVESKDINAVYAATKKALDELGYKVTKDAKDALEAEIVARDAGDDKITIVLKKTAADATKVSIRVGTFGDETKSQLIYGKIRDNL